MRLAGFGTEITSGGQMGPAIDAILSMGRPVEAAAPASAVYANLKVEAQEDHGKCPRCQQGLQKVLLVRDRPAMYCQGCAIALPTKVA